MLGKLYPIFQDFLPYLLVAHRIFYPTTPYFSRGLCKRLQIVNKLSYLESFTGYFIFCKFAIKKIHLLSLQHPSSPIKIPKLQISSSQKLQRQHIFSSFCKYLIRIKLKGRENEQTSNHQMLRQRDTRLQGESHGGSICISC